MEEPRPPSEEWTQLWVQAQPVVSAFIASLVPEVNDADDILQTVALTAIRKFEVFDKNRSFVAWAIGIAKNEIHTHHRKKGKQALSLDIRTMEHIAKVCTDDAEAVYDLRSGPVHQQIERQVENNSRAPLLTGTHCRTYCPAVGHE